MKKEKGTLADLKLEHFYHVPSLNYNFSPVIVGVTAIVKAVYYVRDNIVSFSENQISNPVFWERCEEITREEFISRYKGGTPLPAWILEKVEPKLLIF